MYDSENVFARILKGKLSCQKVYEDTYALAFHDIRPQCPLHVLVIPKEDYISFIDFSTQAPAEFVTGFFKAVSTVVHLLNLTHKGCRFIMNHGADGHQEVPHFHLHILGGKPLGKMVCCDCL